MMYVVHVETDLDGVVLYGPFASDKVAKKWADTQRRNGFPWCRIEELITPSEVQ